MQKVARCISNCREKVVFLHKNKIIKNDKRRILKISRESLRRLEKLKEKDNFYDYEKGFDEIWRDLGRQYMESQMNETSKTQNRRKKQLYLNMEKYQY
jgi:hypothetical protein